MLSINNLENTFPSQEQEKILQSDSKITIVKAVPGSGKTRVFIEFFKNEIVKFNTRSSGIAALSFTNAAYEEISDRLKIPVNAPHFVGTLDSFLYKFVVRPFSHILDMHVDGVRLIVSPIDEHLKGHHVYYGENVKDFVSAFSVKFTSGTIVNPTLIAKTRLRNIVIPPEKIHNALNIKNKLWKSCGLITHSDCHYIAAKILSHEQYGIEISKVIADRFPLILIDEFQDTGCFLSIALKQLINCQIIKSLIVGDPDQSIYEFSGAKPELFKEIENLYGAKTYPITYSQRCAANICNAARYLSETATQLQPKQNTTSGKSILLIHAHKHPQLDSKIIEVIKSLSDGGGEIAVLARTNKIVRGLNGDISDTSFQGSSVAGRAFNKAIEKFLAHDSNTAFRIVSNQMGILLFEIDGIDKLLIESKGIDYKVWKIEIAKLLISLSLENATETWNDWIKKVKTAAETFAVNVGYPASLGPNFRKKTGEGDTIRFLTKPSLAPIDPTLASAIFKNIHEVKGREYDTVVLYFPKPTSHLKCISTTWFNSQNSTEEKRVGYVALTRAKRNLILCLHKDSYSELQKSSMDFINKFEIDFC